MSIKTKIILFSTLCLFTRVNCDGLCGNWDSYKDEKCVHLYDNVSQQTWEAAKGICAKDGATLVTIHSAEEQDFVTKLLFDTHRVVDEVWIGAHRVDKHFRWEGEDMDVDAYTNWADKNPSNLPNEDCVQLLPKPNQKGKWDDENCTKKNLVVCQKMQIWTTTIIQQILLKERKQLEEIMNELKSHDSVINDQKKTIESLKKTIVDTVPIGFTYVQLPKEKAPADIWPNMKWSDVSATYAGVFFRVNGGGAAAFGAVQEEDTPRLNRVELTTNAAGYKDKGDTIGKGGYGKIKAGSTGTPWYFQLYMSNTEVRPKNMAIRVWKRTA